MPKGLLIAVAGMGTLLSPFVTAVMASAQENACGPNACSVGEGRLLSSKSEGALFRIKTGDRVTARVENGNVLLMTSAVAMQAGGLGDRIRVSLSETRIVRAAKIIDRASVLIEEP